MQNNFGCRIQIVKMMACGDGAHSMCFVTKITNLATTLQSPYLKYRNMRKRVSSSTQIKVICHSQHQILIHLCNIDSHAYTLCNINPNKVL